MPGPVCYGRGGAEPTITDANLVLDRIGKGSFLGGEMQLDAGAARHGIAALAQRLGLGGPGAAEEMAQGIIALGTLSMAQAIRQITVERGFDPREFALIAFGGGGPLHSGAIARELNIPEVIIPPEPGIFSALGMILADARVDQTQTFLRDLEAAAVVEMDALFARLESGMRESLTRDLGDTEIVFERQAEMRFRGQRHTMRTPLGAAANVDAVRGAFEATYRRRFGRFDPESRIEFVNLVLTAYARIDRPPLGQLCRVGASGTPAPAGRRGVYFAERGARIDTPVYRREDLPIGFEAAGPAIVEEYGSTTVVGPDDRFAVGRLGEIRLQLGAAQGSAR
jgi:N-methylhydantoinase A